MPVVSVGSRVAYSEKVGWPQFSKALASALDRPNRCFSRQLWEGCPAPAAGLAASPGIALSRSFLRHRERPWGVPDGVSPGFPWQGKSGSLAVQGRRLILMPRLFFSAGAKERDAAEWMYRHAMPRSNGEWLRQGRRRSQPCLAASVTDAMPVEPSTRRFAHVGTPNRTMGMNSRKMAGHGVCKMDVFRESPSCANGRAQGTGSWKVRTVFRRSDNGRPSETQPTVWLKVLQGGFVWGATILG